MRQPGKLYEGNMRKNFLLFSLPLILTALLSQSYSFVNSMMIGRFLGSEAFAATAVSSQLIQFINSIFFGYSTGIGIYVAVLYGQSAYDRMLNIIKLSFLVTSAAAITIVLICNLFCSQILEMLNVNAEIYEDAAAYFRVYTSGYIILQFNWGFVYIARGIGMSKLPLTGSIVSGVTNVLLNYLFLSVFQKGIGYSALATVTANAAIAVYYFLSFRRLFKHMNIRLGGFSVAKDDIRSSFRYSIPTMLQQMAMYFCTALVSPLTNSCPTAAISGSSIANKARSILSAVYQNSSIATTTFIAQAMGAKKIGMIKKGIKIGVTQTLAFFAVAMGLFILFARPFTGLFLDPAEDAESFTVSVTIIRLLLPFLVFNLFNNMFHGIFRAVGSGKLLVISTLIYAVSFTVYAYTIFSLMPADIKIYSIHMAHGAAYITEVLFAAILYATGKWKSPEYRVLEAAAQSTQNTAAPR